MLIFSEENPTMLESSSGQSVDVKVRKQGRNWSFGAERRSGEHSKPRGSVVHITEAIVSCGSVNNGWSNALCGDHPKGGGGWQQMPSDAEVTCKKCLKLQHNA